MKIFKWLSLIFIVFDFLKKSKNEIVFFSEGSHDWEHMKNIIIDLSINKKLKITYLALNSHDDGLGVLKDNNLVTTYLIPSLTLLNIIFKNIEAKVVIMTMTDLGSFFLKKSLHPNVKYCYLFHSINSIHAVYLENAFLNYDYIFTVGVHHDVELKKLFKLKNKKLPNLIQHGSEKLDEVLLLNYQKNNKCLSKVIIGFSWGENSISENIKFISLLISKLLDMNIFVVLRPHAMTLKRIPDYFKKISSRINVNKLDGVLFDTNSNQKNSIINSDFLITDWSGISFEYAFGYKRPILFIDSTQKIRNKKWTDLELPRLEDVIRNKIGVIMSPDQLENLGSYIQKLNKINNNRNLAKNYIYNVGKATSKASAFIKKEFYE